MDDWRSIKTAPRDGTVIEVMADGQPPIAMAWNTQGVNHLVSPLPGLWEMPGGELTWSERDGFGPTHWRAIKTAEEITR